jgi:hypothetical protein
VKGKILEKAQLWIKFLSNAKYVYTPKQERNALNKIPSVIGVIDCTHVRISKPRSIGDEYINRKRFPSLNIQATCDSTERFTSVCAEWAGSTHDSRILRNSTLAAIMKRLNNAILPGDGGYGISPWLITPYKNPVTLQQLFFNQTYAKERVIIERCFGQLKRRFPMLGYKMRVKLESIPAFIICCAVLHNISKYLKDPEDFPEIVEPEEYLRDQHAIEESRINVRRAGQAKREQIAEALYTLYH